MWEYMCNWLAGDLRSMEDTELVGLVTAKSLGTVSMRTLHKKLTK